MTDGFEVPIHQSLTARHMLGGVPRDLGILIWTFVAALTVPLQTCYGIPIGVFVHAVAFAATKRDPDFFDVLKRAVRFGVFYRA